MALEEIEEIVENSKKEKELLDQLAVMRETTRRTGVLFEAQVLQLQNFPWVIFDNIDKLEVQFNHEQKILQYVLKMENKKISKPKDRFKYLCTWVKELLGYEYTCRIVINEKVVYKE